MKSEKKERRDEIKDPAINENPEKEQRQLTKSFHRIPENVIDDILNELREEENVNHE
ncbi:hypothetical protein VDG1235_179 [Verrucomicrobiia bacterium DG1235]|nr:hypothetical protein VDG1235_179 [Verrucomicrobiae bacterium DG1235]